MSFPNVAMIFFLGQEALLTRVADFLPRDKDVRNLMLTATYHHRCLNEYLLKRALIPDICGRNAIVDSARRGLVHCMQEFFRYNEKTGGKFINARQRDAILFEASGHQHVAMVKFLLGKGVRPNTHRVPGRWALHGAVRAGSVEIAELLLDAGAMMEARSLHGWTTLHIAARKPVPDPHMTKFLIDRGADIHAKDLDGMTAEQALGFSMDDPVFFTLERQQSLKVLLIERISRLV
ncbi:hypothetical protein AJ80_08077 [Polytolypa hystricis UAMH7299]|uniref:Uncharacterized protein n=1 Tax=Polytolypa hystricis (strain UAMH7299) TaxID=1447883 RepID=A0A2B7X5Y1_POLH7|nr:hypothetical protein AJ80_08077 [Polytolypa hystricis UAMH7299]